MTAQRYVVVADIDGYHNRAKLEKHCAEQQTGMGFNFLNGRADVSWECTSRTDADLLASKLKKIKSGNVTVKIYTVDNTSTTS